MERTVQKRIYNYDLIRIIAFFGVLFIHVFVVPQADNLVGIASWLRYIIHLFGRISFFMFFILSGALHLNSDDEKLSKFYFKKLIKIIIPFLLYEIIYYIIDPLQSFSKCGRSFFYCVLNNKTYIHMWFIYSIVSIYISTPFLKKMCKALGDKELFNLFLLILFISFVLNLLPVFNVNIYFPDTIFTGNVAYFLIGYIVTNCSILKKKHRLLYCLGGISFFISLFLIKFGIYEFVDNFLYSPFMFIMVPSLFMFLSNINLSKFNKNVLEKMSYYTFDLYFIHILVIAFLVKLSEYCYSYFNNISIWRIVMFVITYVTSFILSVFIRNIIVNPAINFFKFIDSKTFKFLEK